MTASAAVLGCCSCIHIVWTVGFVNYCLPLSVQPIVVKNIHLLHSFGYSSLTAILLIRYTNIFELEPYHCSKFHNPRTCSLLLVWVAEVALREGVAFCWVASTRSLRAWPILSMGPLWSSKVEEFCRVSGFRSTTGGVYSVCVTVFSEVILLPLIICCFCSW